MTTTSDLRLRDGYVLDYDAEERWLVMSDPEGAAQVVARDVRPDDAAYLVAGYEALAARAAQPVSEGVLNADDEVERERESAYSHGYGDGLSARPGTLDVAELADALNEWWVDPNDPADFKPGSIDAEKAAEFIADAYRDYFDPTRAALATDETPATAVLREAAQGIRGWPWEEWRGRVPDGVLMDAGRLADALRPGDGDAIRAVLAATPTDTGPAVSHEARPSDGQANSGGGLDDAWKEAEAALPKGWWLMRVKTTDSKRWYARAENPVSDPLRFEEGMGPTPAAALQALARRLSGPHDGEEGK